MGAELGPRRSRHKADQKPGVFLFFQAGTPGLGSVMCGTRPSAEPEHWASVSALTATSCFLLRGELQTCPLACPGPEAFDISAEAKTLTLENCGMCHPNVTEKPATGPAGGPGEGARSTFVHVHRNRDSGLEGTQKTTFCEHRLAFSEIPLEMGSSLSLEAT